ncbi:MAG: ATP-dependent helicase [Actinobacteria bacterium]|nr:ATP-dependent helicase [Actinomycetota bacterium]
MTIIPTPEQRAIIEYPLLPLRVTAGAGTGKTTTMALRLEHLVRSGMVEPEQALGVTFTNKAAEELAAKLRSFLPHLSEEGREVEVATYHGFAHGLLREFGPFVGVERSATVITPGFTRQLLRDALGSAEHCAIDLTMPGSRVDELAALAGQLGDHLLEPSDFLASGGDDVESARAEMAAALVAYRRSKQALGVVDYADLIAAAHRLVTGHPEITERIRSRYRVVLLDEYQDTNPAQRQMLRAVFGSGFPVTAVGDADQTIYEWRGASLQNFADFPRHFPCADGTPAATLHLTLNRRSTKRVIDLANRVRSEIGRPGDLGDLRALDEAERGAVRAGWFRTSLDEARWVAAEVRRLHDDGVAWKSIGILFRKHAQIGLVREALERQGVPVEVASLGGLLGIPEVTDLHAWLRILGRPDDAPALMRILLGTGYRLGMGDIAPLARWVRARHGEVGDDDAGGVGWALLEAADRFEDCAGLGERAATRLGAFRATYRSLLEEAQGVSLVELCRIVLDRTGAWPEVEALDDAARLSARLNLYRFLDLAEEWSPLEGRPSLEAFLDYLDLLQEDRGADELDTARISGEDAVAMLTVHRAKGLEWPVVFLPALCQNTFPSPGNPYADPLAHPQFLPYERRLDAAYLPALPHDAKERKALIKAHHADGEWRTAYVAVTRAAVQIIATGAFWFTEKTAKKPSRIFELAMETEGVEVVAQVTDPGDPPESLRFPSDPADGPDPLFQGGWRAALRAAIEDPGWPARFASDHGLQSGWDEAVGQLSMVLDDLPAAGDHAGQPPVFRTSVTGLVAFASCPQRFHWSEVDRLPRRPSPALRHGVEVHRRIELHHRGAVPLEEADPGFYDLGPSEEGRPGSFRAFLESRFAEERPILVEAPFELRVGGGILAGRIDAVYQPEPGTWEVVDFKSGRRSDDPSRRAQLQAYAVAATDAGFSAGRPQRILVSFAYLGGGLEEVTEVVDAQWLQDARDHLGELMAAAASGGSDPQPSEACRSCDFTRFCRAGMAWMASRDDPVP